MYIENIIYYILFIMCYIDVDICMYEYMFLSVCLLIFTHSYAGV